MLHEIEITEIDSLLDSDKKLVDLHTVLNIVNVLFGELQLLSCEFPDPQLFTPSLDRCEYILEALYDSSKVVAMVESMAESEKLILDNVQIALAQYTDKEEISEVQLSIANVRSVFEILEARIRELVNRWQSPNRWLEYEIEPLKQNFVDWLAAIAQNSKGRYRIIYNLVEHSDSSYFVALNINSPTGKTITIPPNFQDVMRDLLANSRKYSPLGGQIIIDLRDDGKHLHFVIEDTGRGIPKEEITKVVNFGIRGSNVQNIRSMGGGMGLTKAFLVTKRFGGRMWIASAKDLGTKITIIIPNHHNYVDQLDQQ